MELFARGGGQFELGSRSMDALESGHMKFWALWGCSLCLVSCVHTAIAPVCTPEGVPAVIRVPKARYGEKAKPEVVKAMDEKIAKNLASPGAPPSSPPQPVTGSTQIGVVGIVGDVKTKKGERFVGYSPMIVIRSTLPADQIDRAAGVIAANWYRSAKKSYDVYPITDFADAPKKKP